MNAQDDSGTHATLADLGDDTHSQKLPRGSNLGRYVIIEPIGSGGMGTVYRAYDPQLNRGVALKILSVKQEDQQAAERAKARLIREAQALAQLSHPNVVAVHDAGTFEDDVFIAMELVEGKTLNEWMKEEKRPIKEVLAVMTAAGRGLSSAHKAGLVHRDFKPGNVIVGDDGRVRVLDFGLARAVDQIEEFEEIPTVSESAQAVLDEQSPVDWKEISSDSSPNLLQSPLTHAGGVLGTPMYMAPEQHLGLKTDERTDQFGFCVVLYEVLYGRRPFAARSMGKLKKEVILQRIRIPQADTDVPTWLWQIIRKGLSPKSEDRYSTIDLLLNDLDKDPEEVRRQKRLARRRKLLVISLILLTTALPFGVWYGIQYRAVQLCKAAEGEFDGVWDDATKVSVRTAFLETKTTFSQGTWERVERFFDRYLNDWTLMRSDVCEARMIRGTQSEELFDLRMFCLKKRLGELKALVEVFAGADTGVVEKAVQASSSLTDIGICADEEALRAPYSPPKTQEAKAKVAAIREKLVRVEALSKTGKYKEGLELAEKLEKDAKAVNYLPVQAEVLYQVGYMLDRTGDYKSAEITLLEAARVAGETRYAQIAARAMVWLVWVVGYRQARHEAGLSHGKDAGVMLGFARGEKTTRARLLNNLGTVFHNIGKYDEALENFQKSLAMEEKALGPDHPNVTFPLNNIAEVFRMKRNYEKALQSHRRALAIREKACGLEHPSVAQSLSNLASVLLVQGEYDQSLEYCQRALTISEKAVGKEHPAVASRLNSLGVIFWSKEDYNRALDHYQRALQIWKKSLGSVHPKVAYSHNNIGLVLWKKREYKNASLHLRKALEIWEASLGKDHPNTAWPLSGLGEVYLAMGKRKAALEKFMRVTKICEQKSCVAEPYGRGLFGLARTLLASGSDKNRAIDLAKHALDLFENSPKIFENIER